MDSPYQVVFFNYECGAIDYSHALFKRQQFMRIFRVPIDFLPDVIWKYTIKGVTIPVLGLKPFGRIITDVYAPHTLPCILIDEYDKIIK